MVVGGEKLHILLALGLADGYGGRGKEAQPLGIYWPQAWSVFIALIDLVWSCKGPGIPCTVREREFLARAMKHGRSTCSKMTDTLLSINIQLERTWLDYSVFLMLRRALLALDHEPADFLKRPKVSVDAFGTNPVSFV